MTPERTARLVARWVRFYTRGLPASISERRVDEINADLGDHVAHERARGVSDRRIALSILSRMVRGLAADASWRTRQKSAYRSAVRVVIATGCLLLIPLLAMQFSDEVVWTLSDFIFAGVLFAGTGFMYQLAARKAGGVDATYRVAAGLALGAALMLVWLVGAVGVIGEDGDPADLMYAGVLAVGVAGTILARFRPDGMARTLLAMAAAQALVAGIALALGKHQAAISSVAEIVLLNGFFVALFIGSAGLFSRAALTRR